MQEKNFLKVQWVYDRLLIKRTVIIYLIPCRHAPLQCNFLIPCLKRCLFPHLSGLGHVTCSGYWDTNKHASKRLRSAYVLVACLLLAAARTLRTWRKPDKVSLLSHMEEKAFQPPAGEWGPLRPSRMVKVPDDCSFMSKSPHEIGRTTQLRSVKTADMQNQSKYNGDGFKPLSF